VKKAVGLVVGCLVISALPSWGVCPPEDITGDCIVNLQDLAALSHAWLTGDGIPQPEDMVYIPTWAFIMGDLIGDGSANERPAHRVTLDPYYMGKYEISNAQYCAFLNSSLQQGLISVVNGVVYAVGSGTSHTYFDTYNASSYSQISFSGSTFTVNTKGGRNMANDPVVMVTWYGAIAYCNWRSQQEGKQACYNLYSSTCNFTKKGYRLPTEAEWECAARGGGGWMGKRFPWGDTIAHSQANYFSRYDIVYDISPTRTYHPMWKWDGIEPYTCPVDTYPTNNGFDLYNMVGNVWQWCNDLYSSNYYSSSPQLNPTGPTSGSDRVFRGGCWRDDATYCRVSSRIHNSPSLTLHCLGFRIVLDLN
jgi:sulfatase modifying factor 1